MIRCPNCEGTNVTTLALAHEQGLSKINTATVGVGLGKGLLFGSGLTGGTSQTKLSKRLAPPKKKGMLFPRMLVGYFVLDILLAIIAISSKNGNTNVKNTLLIAVILVPGTMLIAAIVWCYKRNKWNRTVYAEQYAKWADQYICLTCGKIFEIKN